MLSAFFFGISFDLISKNTHLIDDNIRSSLVLLLTSGIAAIASSLLILELRRFNYETGDSICVIMSATMIINGFSRLFIALVKFGPESTALVVKRP